jgi:hypothetical protein
MHDDKEWIRKYVLSWSTLYFCLCRNWIMHLMTGIILAFHLNTLNKSVPTSEEKTRLHRYNCSV